MEDINPLNLINEPKKPIQVGDIQLTQEQKDLILARWNDDKSNPPSKAELVKLVWPDATKEMLDGRSLHARAVSAVATGYAPTVITQDTALNLKPSQLTPEQEEFILNNCKIMKPLQMTREIFSNPSLSPVSSEARLVTAFFRSINPAILFGDDVPEPDYNPPTRVVHVVARIRKYVNSAKDWNESKLTPAQRKNCEALITYLHDLRFKRQIDSYEKTEDKIILESEFIKYTYNKPELEQEEISQYIVYCSLVVNEFNIKDLIEMLQTQMRVEYDNGGRADTRTIEALESARTELNNCITKQKQLLESLTEKRSDKISKELKDKESLLNLFNTWKQQETRQQLLKIRQKDKEVRRKELHEIEEMSELKQRVLGLSIDEILNG